MSDTIDLKIAAPDWHGAGAGDDRTPVFTGYAVVGFFTNHNDAEAQALGLENDCGGKWDVLAIIPRPKTRRKTGEELLEGLVEFYFESDGKAGLAEHDTRLADAWARVARELVDGNTLDDLCRAAGISLEVTE